MLKALRRLFSAPFWLVDLDPLPGICQPWASGLCALAI